VQLTVTVPGKYLAKKFWILLHLPSFLVHVSTFPRSEEIP
jgi:hypothetical protein